MLFRHPFSPRFLAPHRSYGRSEHTSRSALADKRKEVRRPFCRFRLPLAASRQKHMLWRPFPVAIHPPRTFSNPDFSLGTTATNKLLAPVDPDGLVRQNEVSGLFAICGSSRELPAKTTRFLGRFWPI